MSCQQNRLFFSKWYESTDEGFCVTPKHRSCVGPQLLPGLAKSQGIHLWLPVSSCLPPPGVRNLRLISPHILKCHSPFHLPMLFTSTTLRQEVRWEQLLSHTNIGTRGQGRDLPGTFPPFPGLRRGNPSHWPLFHALSPTVRKLTIKLRHPHGGIALLPALVVSWWFHNFRVVLTVPVPGIRILR